jgi:hypothetical protein
VHFTLQKPFTPELMSKTLKAGYSLIVQEKRKSFRHPVLIDANATYLHDGTRLTLENTKVLDISQTGLRMQSDSAIPKDGVVFLDFKLPETEIPLSIIGKTMWTDAGGRAGIQFRFMTPIELENLRDWLAQRYPWDVELEARTQQDPAAATVPVWIH